MKIKGHFTNACFVPVKPFATASGSLNWCDSPKADLAMRALKQMGEVLSIICELCLDKQ